jgi:ABC-type amino acid transport substrate-binding protein
MCGREGCEKGNLQGRDIELMKVLVEALNFTLKVELFNFDNIAGSMASLLNGTVDVAIGDFFLKLERIQQIEASVGYFTSDMTFVVPEGRPFTSLECLLMPFAVAVWVLVIIYVFLGVFAVQLLKRGERVKAFEVERRMDSPTMTMVAILMGISLRTVSSRNFNRFMLMNFILFWFVMRTVYLGSMYGFVQSDMTHKSVETVEEMVKNNFKFYVVGWNDDMLTDAGIKKENIVTIEANEVGIIMEKLKNPNFKGVFARSSSRILYFNHIKQFNFIYKMTERSLFNVQVVLFLRKSSPFTEPINRKLQQLTEGGFINLWHRKHHRKHDTTSSLGPKVLTFTHLKGIFQIWLFLSTVAVFIFAAEYLSLRINNECVRLT